MSGGAIRLSQLTNLKFTTMSEASIFIGGHTVYCPEFEYDVWDMYPHINL